MNMVKINIISGFLGAGKTTLIKKLLTAVKGEKIIIFKYKSKKNYHRKAGHRQQYTKVEITSIG